MNSKYNEGILNITMPESINVQNARDFETDLFAIVNSSKDAKELVLDADNLNYISSVGLRIIMKLKKSITTPLTIINVSNDIYSIFEMTCFTALIQLKKKLRFIDINSSQLLGAGMYGSVYRINEEQILKVFHDIYSEDAIQPVIDTIRIAFVHGIPTIIPFEIVQTEKGIGMVLELLNSKMLSTLIAENPNQLDIYINDMIELLKSLANEKFDEGTIRTRNEMLTSKLEEAEEFLSSEEITQIKKYIDAIPNRQTAVHGDFHAKNIMVVDDKPMLIDMDEFSLGHPIWDVANANFIYQFFPHMNPKFNDEFLDLKGKIAFSDFYFKLIGCTIDEAEIIWSKFFNRYFEGYSQEDKNSILRLVEFYANFKLITFLLDVFSKVKDDPEQLAVKLKHLRNILAELKKQNLDELIKCLDLWK